MRQSYSFGRCIRVRLNTNVAREDYEVQDQMIPNVNYNLFQIWPAEVLISILNLI